MASSHGVPRVAKEGDGELEKENIRDYRTLLDLIAAKVRRRHQLPSILRTLIQSV